MENSNINWTDNTFNPWIGCTRVSPACENCYAETLATRMGLADWGPKAERRATGSANWKKPLAWNRKAARDPEKFSPKSHYSSPNRYLPRTGNAAKPAQTRATTQQSDLSINWL